MTKFTKTKNTKASTVSTIGTANAKLREKLDNMSATTKAVKSVYVPPVTDTTNINGRSAYTKDEFTHLLTLLNTLKLDGNQFYRTEANAMRDVQLAVEKCAKIDPYFTAQCIRWSRSNGEGLRSVNHLAAAILVKYLSGQEYARYVYSAYNKSNNIGGFVHRIDDMAQIANVFFYLNSTAKSLPNSIRKGFKSAIENADAYTLGKYKNSGLIDIINLVHPDIKSCKAKVEVDRSAYIQKLKAKVATSKSKSNKEKAKDALVFVEKGISDKYEITAVEAIMLGLNYAVNTHEVRNSEAGQMVAAAVKAGKLTEREAVELLAETKAENFKELLATGKMGVLATIRNLVRMVKNNVDPETVSLVVGLLRNQDAVRKSLVNPMHFDIAYEMLNTTFGGTNSIARAFMDGLQKGFEFAIQNAKLSGKVAVFVDMSGSMNMNILVEGENNKYKSSAIDKACLIAAVYAKSSNADIYGFDSSTIEVGYTPNKGVFELAKDFKQKSKTRCGSTNISSPFNFISAKNKKYDRIILISDNEANTGSGTRYAAAHYINNISSDVMIYSVDLAAYGTTQLKGKNIFEVFGYGFTMYEDIANREFDPNAHLTAVSKVRFKDDKV